MEIPAAVYVIWWITLGIVVLAVLPLAVYLLHRAFMAARQIERYAARTLDAGKRIAGNMESIEALERTISTATGVLDAAGGVRRYAGAIEEAFERRTE